MKRAGYGFSLMELLIVIAIIGVLAALLMPTLRRALETARVAGCLNNQRQNYLVFSYYRDDFSGYYPGFGGGSSKHAGQRGLKSLMQYYQKTFGAGNGSSLSRKEPTWLCPSCVLDHPKTTTAADLRQVCYGISQYHYGRFFDGSRNRPITDGDSVPATDAYCDGVEPFRPERMSVRRGNSVQFPEAKAQLISSPALLVLLGNTSAHFDGFKAQSTTSFALHSSGTNFANYDLPMEHGTGSNFLYLDGHGSTYYNYLLDRPLIFK